MRLELTNRSTRIREVLTQVFAPQSLEVDDQSHLHAGHAGASPEGETHYKVTIVSEKFHGMSRVAVQREINKALKNEFESGLHALSIKASAPAG
ncbi:MAG: BolA family protein [Henriciella sp.]|uniref:BolA family protein n=1 Tax=Henriciella sp. TaxID=1968823 RepID=UPI003C70816B